MQQRNVSFISCLLASYPNLHHPLYSEKLSYFVFSKLSTKGRSRNRRGYISVNSVTSQNSNPGKTADIDSSVNVAVLVHFCLDEKQQFGS